MIYADSYAIAFQIKWPVYLWYKDLKKHFKLVKTDIKKKNSLNTSADNFH